MDDIINWIPNSEMAKERWDEICSRQPALVGTLVSAMRMCENSVLANGEVLADLLKSCSLENLFKAEMV